ncbi:hypothetical protein L228DRAFT_269447 [Xylona heveae TC161]|uniref:Autophagy-related protein 13 n=1 Tax=Xylona heveae (strain CBS 132557 / TC161) TaxID=1328760 RepID=A0A165FJ63_XYLHT|nr:hypothetical protein L228DRAFT_269447 [Xylona heveae TC161]KZF21038.1 hypothetical protein L228DRAFT_269447 [Xylona heveae TC161]
MRGIRRVLPTTLILPHLCSGLATVSGSQTNQSEALSSLNVPLLLTPEILSRSVDLDDIEARACSNGSKMHQYTRTPPRTASPANSPWTNPTRTNNSRDPVQMNPPVDKGAGDGDGDDGLQAQQPSSQSRDVKSKLNQIIQNFHTKAALIILQSRVPLPPAHAKGTDTVRVNKWFNVELDETEVLRDDLRPWKTCDAVDPRPPPLFVEVYLDTADLTNNQSLVTIDDQGKRWDVLEALSAESPTGRRATRTENGTQVVLEQWQIELGQPTAEAPADLASILPAVYKKSIVLFRSLYTYSKFLPAWKFSKHLAKQRTSFGALRLRYRIFNGAASRPTPKADPLRTALFPANGRVTETFSFGSTDSPAGPFSIQVTYRTSCEFRVDDSEALLSSHFMGIDEHFFKPSLGGADEQPAYIGGGREVGSLPQAKRDADEMPDPGQAYGSLSTFHHIGAPSGSSPISALRAARDLAGGGSPSSVDQRTATLAMRSTHGSKASLRSIDSASAAGRRPSVSFMPFKTPTLSASPSKADPVVPPSPRASVGKAASGVSALTQARNRSSLGVLPQTALRAAPNSNESAIASSPSASPRPAPVVRYSSSFSHRRGRLSSGGNSKADDDNTSSGKTSLASSLAPPGSGILAEGATGSLSSIKTDDDNISDFLKMLDTKKDLKSFQGPVGPTAALSRFQRMRDSNAALSDSMSSSMLMHRSSSSSSRQLYSVPAMIAGTSISTAASSPGKPISPHTPHTPAIPSRLSANSIADYPPPHRSRTGGRRRNTRDEDDEDSRRESNISEELPSGRGSGAIPIPTSPRPHHSHNRRSSSVAHQRHVTAEEESADLLPMSMRSASLGAEVPPLSLSALVNLQETPDPDMPSDDGPVRPLQPTTSSESQAIPSSVESPDDGLPSHPRSTTLSGLHSSSRQRYGTGNRRLTPPQTSGSFERGTGSSASDRRGGRYSFTRPGTFDEDEPLLFAMSDFGGVQSRRSIEEGRNEAPTERGGSSASSRRGSRRGHLWG